MGNLFLNLLEIKGYFIYLLLYQLFWRRSLFLDPVETGQFSVDRYFLRCTQLAVKQSCMICYGGLFWKIFPEKKGFFIDADWSAGQIGRAMSGKTAAYYIVCIVMGDCIIKTDPDTLELCRTGLDPHGIVIVQRGIILYPGFDNGI